MWLHHLDPGQPASLFFGDELPATTLVQANNLEVVRLALRAREEVPWRPTHGPTTLQCLRGRVSFVTTGKYMELCGGDFVYLNENEPLLLRAISDSTLLVTTLAPKTAESNGSRYDPVQEASEESFPASDPPAW